jgi:uncharacterized protein (TIGR03435 family)
MIRTLLAVALAVCPATAATVSFDVASVRVSQAGGRRENIHVSPDTVTMRNVSLKSCIGWAYHVMDYQVSGPDWLGSQRYDIVAKAAGPAPEDDLRTMMQALLADRFKVESHRQTKEMSAYILVPGKGGPKVHESQTDGPPSIQPDRSRMTVAVQRGQISQLVDVLSNFFHAPVIDETGLKGRYDLTVNVAKYLPQAGDAPPDPLSLIATALQEELGLKLESRKTAVDLVVIDHAEKTPTEN